MKCSHIQRECVLHLCWLHRVCGFGLKTVGFKCNKINSGPVSAAFHRTENNSSLIKKLLLLTSYALSRSTEKGGCKTEMVEFPGQIYSLYSCYLKSSFGSMISAMWKSSRVSLKKIGKYTGKTIGSLR